MKAWRWFKEHLVLFVGLLVLLYMLIPIVIVAIFSFNDPSGKFNYAWEGFTTKYWSKAFAIPELTNSMVTSLQLAALTAIGATILGTLLAIALVRYQFFGRKAANLLIVVPMATPEVVTGAALLSMFLLLDIIPLGFKTLLIAHIMFSVSFVVIVVRSRLIGFDRRLEEAAADLGASAMTTFRKVTLPLIAPGVVSAGLLSFALSIDDFVISNFNSGSTVTFPLYIYGANQRGIPVQVNVIATMLFVVTILVMVAVILQQRRAEKMSQVQPEPEDSDAAQSLSPA